MPAKACHDPPDFQRGVRLVGGRRREDPPVSTPHDTGRPTDEAVSSGTEAGDAAAMLRALATSVALLPQVPQPEGQEAPEGAIALPVIEQDGQRFIPVFTSEDSLRAAGGDPSSAVRIPIAQLAANWPNEDVWLAVNPASEEGLGLPPDVVRALPVFATQTTEDGHGGAGDAAAGGGSAGAEPEAPPT
jgi:hypothetical protein